MAVVARRAVVVNDLLRARLAFGLVWLVTRLFRCHPISRHDGPLSVRRAYSAAELSTLARKAGITTLRVRAYPFLGRLVAGTARPPPAPAPSRAGPGPPGPPPRT